MSDFERLGDHAVNISEVAAELNEKKIAFSDEAQYELDVLENAVKECVSLACRPAVTPSDGGRIAVLPGMGMLAQLAFPLPWCYTELGSSDRIIPQNNLES